MRSIDIYTKTDIEKICKSNTEALGDFIFNHINKLKERIDLLEQEIRIIKASIIVKEKSSLTGE